MEHTDQRCRVLYITVIYCTIVTLPVWGQSSMQGPFHVTLPSTRFVQTI